MINILSVDWDFFLPVPNDDPVLWPFYDWGHRETGSFFLNEIWYGRALPFDLQRLPRPRLTDEVKTFWSRFRFSPDCKLHFSDSHKFIAHVLEPFANVTSYDAHHDGGYGQKYVPLEINCHDWARVAVETLNCDVTTIYPTWKKTLRCQPEPKPDCKELKRKSDTGRNCRKVFDLVFVCRSGGWVPPWLDDQFDEFIKTPGLQTVSLDGLVNRNWDESKMKAEYDLHAEMLQIFDVGPPK